MERCRKLLCTFCTDNLILCHTGRWEQFIRLEEMWRRCQGDCKLSPSRDSHAILPAGRSTGNSRHVITLFTVARGKGKLEENYFFWNNIRQSQDISSFFLAGGSRKVTWQPRFTVRCTGICMCIINLENDNALDLGFIL